MSSGDASLCLRSGECMYTLCQGASLCATVSVSLLCTTSMYPCLFVGMHLSLTHMCLTLCVYIFREGCVCVVICSRKILLDEEMCVQWKKERPNHHALFPIHMCPSTVKQFTFGGLMFDPTTISEMQYLSNP